MRRQKLKPEDFKSPQEIETWKLLKGNQRKFGYDIEYEPEALEYAVVKNYFPDFKLSFRNGACIYIEYKGYLRRDDERKLLAVKQQHPDIDLRIVFQRDNRLTGRRMRYSDWAIKHGFRYAIGEVPSHWFEEAMEGFHLSDT